MSQILRNVFTFGHVSDDQSFYFHVMHVAITIVLE